MGDALTITEVGMLNGMRHLDMISHNLANADTAGFKRDVAVMRPFGDYLGGAGGARVNAGLTPLQGVSDHSTGVPHYTGNALDVAIEGDGYFEVEAPECTLYTRQGTFALDAEGFLVNASGHRVAGEAGAVRLASDQPRIERDGSVWDGERFVDRLRVARFSDSRELDKLGGGLYAPGQAQPLPEGGRAPGLRQGYVETSNVNAMGEMVDLISTMRQLESGQKVLRGYDEMLDLAIQTIAEI